MIEDKFREGVYRFVDSLQHGHRQPLNPDKPTYNDFVDIIKEIITADPEIGLEFNEDYTLLIFYDNDFSTRFSKSYLDRAVVPTKRTAPQKATETKPLEIQKPTQVIKNTTIDFEQVN